MFILGDLNADLKTCNGNKLTQLCYEHNLQYLGARVNLKIRKKAAYLRHVWLYKQANFDLFRAGLSDADFDEVFALDHIDDICKAWTEKFLSIAKLFIPDRDILVRPK